MKNQKEIIALENSGPFIPNFSELENFRGWCFKFERLVLANVRSGSTEVNMEFDDHSERWIVSVTCDTFFTNCDLALDVLAVPDLEDVPHVSIVQRRELVPSTTVADAVKEIDRMVVLVKENEKKLRSAYIQSIDLNEQ